MGLSLGLGIATAAFSIMNAAALRGEGLLDPDRAPGVLRTTDRSVSTAWTYDEFLHLRQGSTRMQVEAVLTDAALVRTTAAEAEAPSAGLAFVSCGFFAATGGRVIAGRPREAADEQHAGPPPVVVSFVFWTSRLNRDPQAGGAHDLHWPHSRDESKTTTKSLDDHELSDWLGVRDGIRNWLLTAA